MRTYHHSTDYTSLTRAAYEHARELEAETGLPLVRSTGGLHLAPNDAAGNAEIASYGRALAGLLTRTAQAANAEGSEP